MRVMQRNHSKQRWSTSIVVASLLCTFFGVTCAAQDLTVRELPIDENLKGDGEVAGFSALLQRARVYGDSVSVTADIPPLPDQVRQGRVFWLSHESELTEEMLGGRSVSDWKWSISTHPEMFYDRLPFRWEAVWRMPLINLLPEFPDYSTASEITFLDLLNHFNVQVVVPSRYDFTYPETAGLVFELRNRDRAIEVNLPMRFDSYSNSYFISEVERFHFRLREELARFHRGDNLERKSLPEIKFKALMGFEFNENTVSNFVFTGIPVAHNFRFGSTVVDSGFQWAGKPEKLPLRYPQLPFLTE